MPVLGEEIRHNNGIASCRSCNADFDNDIGCYCTLVEGPKIAEPERIPNMVPAEPQPPINTDDWLWDLAIESV